MANTDERPDVWVGHIVLPTDRLEDSHAFMVRLGMRPIEKGDDFAVLELRAGTHLILIPADEPGAGDAPFDLMVDDLDATRARLGELGLGPSEIEDGDIHRSFTVRDPGGRIITFNSSHNSGKPV